MAEQVGAVRRDLEVEDHIGRLEVAEKSSDWGGGVEDEQARLVVAEAEFPAAAHHAVGLDVAQLSFLDHNAAGQRGAGERQRHLVADLVVLRAADDLARGAAAVIHLADAEPVGVRVLHGFEDLRDDDLVGVDAAHFDALDLDAGEREQVAQLLDGHVREVEMGFEPGQGDFHAGFDRINWINRTD